MMRTTARLSVAALLAALLAGCGGVDTAADPQEDPVPTSSSPDVPGAGSPDVRRAVEDLAGTLDVTVEEVSVVEVEEVTWRDGSLGCAEKGMSYTQALVDGQRIVLEVDGARYEYHSGARRPPFLCEDPTQ
jgi:hypothetical protein